MKLIPVILKDQKKRPVRINYMGRQTRGSFQLREKNKSTFEKQPFPHIPGGKIYFEKFCLSELDLQYKKQAWSPDRSINQKTLRSHSSLFKILCKKNHE